MDEKIVGVNIFIPSILITDGKSDLVKLCDLNKTNSILNIYLERIQEQVCSFLFTVLSRLVVYLIISIAVERQVNQHNNKTV